LRHFLAVRVVASGLELIRPRRVGLEELAGETLIVGVKPVGCLVVIYLMGLGRLLLSIFHLILNYLRDCLLLRFHVLLALCFLWLAGDQLGLAVPLEVLTQRRLLSGGR